jgi:hypothetical protein
LGLLADAFFVDLTKVERACWAALEWDRVGLNGVGRGGDRTAKAKRLQANDGAKPNFLSFAERYKVNNQYASKSLAILNHWNPARGFCGNDNPIVIVGESPALILVIRLSLA